MAALAGERPDAKARRTPCVPLPWDLKLRDFSAPISASPLDTAGRTEPHVTYSKQTIGVSLTRHYRNARTLRYLATETTPFGRFLPSDSSDASIRAPSEDDALTSHRSLRASEDRP